LCFETRSQAQKPAHKDLKHNDQSAVIALEAAYTPASKRGWLTLCFETRSQAQKPAHKDLKHNDQSAVIALEAAYAPVSKRACSRS
ncbi:hypothetical protein, partial [Lacticaseibacillus paracasei]|uniref:hypothetical protein n=1 Tax=Lacticaseibacillus paracasei TaxID=1597 RepID=UPI003393DEF7